MVILFLGVLVGSICFFAINRLLKREQTRRVPRTMAIACFTIGLICMLVPFVTDELLWMRLGTPLALFGIIAIIRVQLYVN
jgi:uncharacterized membrane protein HdeD (DUF308 family)